MSRAPDLWTLAWSHWSLVPGLDAAALATVSAYLLATRRVRRGWPRRRTIAFCAGIFAVLLATSSGYDAEDDRLLSAHMIQHLLLLEVAPLLMLAGAPALLVLQAAPRRARPRLARAFARLRPLSNPLLCLAVFFAIVFGAHTPAFFDATIHHPLLHDGEHLAFLVAGLVMWWPVLDGDPIPGRRLGGLSRLTYLMAAMLPMTIIGAFLNRDPTVFYTAYEAPARGLGISAVADQQQAGAIMWIVGSLIMVAAGLWQVMAALKAEERRHQHRERRLDAIAARGGQPT